MPQAITINKLHDSCYKTHISHTTFFIDFHISLKLQARCKIIADVYKIIANYCSQNEKIFANFIKLSHMATMAIDSVSPSLLNMSLGTQPYNFLQLLCDILFFKIGKERLKFLYFTVHLPLVELSF